MSIEEREIVWSFGFLDAEEVDGVQEAYEQTKAAQGTVEELQQRLDKLYNAFKPLLANLKQSPEKDYILFPGRGPKIEMFEAQLAKIYYGES